MAPSKHSHRAIERTGRRNTPSIEASVSDLSDTTEISAIPTFDDLLEIGSAPVLSELPTVTAPVTPQESAASAVVIDGPLRRDRRKSEKTTKSVKATKTPKVAKAPKPAAAAFGPAASAASASAASDSRTASDGRRRSLGARRTSSAPRKSHLRSIVSVSAMVGVFAILVSTTTPATAFYSAAQIEAQGAGTTSGSAASLASVEPQKVTVNAEAATAAAAGDAVARDSYEAKAVRQQITTLRGNANFDYTNNPFGSIQWPFPGTVPISSGFGSRNVCSYCSSYHLGVDFTPGSGVPIQSIADGVVSQVNISGGGLGNNVMIDHVINGQRVQSVYAHMQWGSIQVAVGQQVSVGTTIGAVGSTGNSTGAHLHLEVHLDGTPVDPYAWLKANAN